MTHLISIADGYLDGVAKRNEEPAQTVRRLLVAERDRLEGRTYRPGKSTARVHLTEKAAAIIDTLRRSYRLQTGLWPEQN